MTSADANTNQPDARPEAVWRTEQFNEVGDGQYLHSKLAGSVHHIREDDQWVKWGAPVWVRDIAGTDMEGLAKKVFSERALEFAKIEDDQERQAAYKWLDRVASLNRIKHAIRLLASEDGVSRSIEDFDAGTIALVPFHNGVYDLEQKTLRPHSPEDLFTRCIPHNYVPEASRTRFEAFLREILGGDEELLGYLKRAAGYSVTGSVVERILFILYGPVGRNGKSTFLNLLTYALGPFAQPMRADVLMQQKYRGIPTEVAALRGKRFVPILETAASHRFDEALLKSLTGGDRLVARRLYGQEFSFDPMHKLWLASNYLPVIRGTDDAVWERLHTIPFLKPVAKPDKQLGDKLRAEVEGFCAWLIEGALEWREAGLNPPDSVLSANRDYRESMDTIGQFITEECVTHPGAWIGATELHDAYVDWCGRNHYIALRTVAFGRELTKREFPAVKGGGHQHLMTRHRIGLRSHAGSER